MKILNRKEMILRQLYSGKTQEMLSLSSVISDQLKTDQVFLAVDILMPGRSSSAPHRHSEIDEIILVLQGTPTLIFGNEKHLLHEGSFVCFDASEEEFHQLMNETETDVEILTISKPREKDRVIYESQRLEAKEMI